MQTNQRPTPPPGDDLLPNALGSATHAVTIGRPRGDVWPWLVQMGAGRAGWYGYNFIDDGRRRPGTALS